MATAQQVIRVRQRETIADPAVKALIMRAAEKALYPGVTPEAVYAELADNIAGDNLGCFVGFSFTDEPVAIATAFLPSTIWMAGPQVPMAYSEDRALSLLVGQRLVDWLKRNGQQHFYCINFQHNDRAYERVFRHAAQLHVVGTAFEGQI